MKGCIELDTVVLTWDPSIWEVEAGGSGGQQVGGQSKLHETYSQRNSKQKGNGGDSSVGKGLAMQAREPEFKPGSHVKSWCKGVLK